ncbi:MAG: PPC domain-containing protein [Pirellulales bacterium]
MRIRSLAACLAFVVALVAAASTAVAQPVLSSTTPGAVAPGKTVDLVLQGQKLDDPLTLWSSFPGKFELVPLADPKPGQTTRTVKVTLDPAVPVGVGGIMVATPAGSSETLLLLVDDLPSVADNGQNQAPVQAQALTLPIAVDGVSDGSRFDYYKFSVQAGQRVAVEVYAGRLAQDYDPVLRLLDATGKELISADDDAGLGADCRFAHTFQAAGDYLIEIRDNQYRGGGRYRLRVGDFPLASTAFPLAVQAGTTAKVGGAGPEMEGAAQADVAVPAPMAGERLPVGVKYPGGVSSALATVVASKWPEAVEVEPNNELAQANPLSTPGGVSGRFESPRDRDCYQFEAKAGQRWAFRALSRSVGSPAIVKMYVQKADGAAVAESPVSEADEESLVVAIPADGSYRLVVQDLLKRGGPDFAYRVSAEPVAPFTLSLKPDKATRYRYQLAKNGAMSIEVLAARNGYDGPITLSVEGPGGAYQVFSNVIGEKAPSARMYVIPPAGLTPGQFAAIKIVGTATVNGEAATATTSTADLVRVLRPQLAYPPAWLDGLIPTAVANDVAPFYTATLDRPMVVIARSAPQAEFNVKLERKDANFKDPLTILLPQQPAGFSFEVKRNGNGPQETYQVVVKPPAGMPDGMHTVKVLSYGELAGQGYVALSTEVPIQIVTPLAVTLSPGGGLVFGNKQKIKVSVARTAVGGAVDKQPVVVKWKKLPPGVTGPAEVTIPADQDAAVVELTAAPDAAAGAFADLTVTATTKFQGQDVAIDSAPLGGEIVK